MKKQSFKNKKPLLEAPAEESLKNHPPTPHSEAYAALEEVFEEALYRASKGKGAERHGDAQPFEKQDICSEQSYLGQAPIVYQIRKKAKESLRLFNDEQKVNEYLDIIIYAAAAIIVLSREP